jgi:hypothetical protein
VPKLATTRVENASMIAEPAQTEHHNNHIDIDYTKNESLQKLRDRWNAEIADITGEIPLKLPPSREINHRIHLIDPEQRYRTHPPRCPDAFHSVLMDKINKYTKAGWWTSTQVPTASALPMLCIPKKSGKLRTAIDLRERNNNTVHDVTPLPDQERIRNDVAQAKFRSKLDMSDAYEQIRIVDEDVHKTSFATIFGTYQSKVMQIGDCNAPATFQRLMTYLFRDHIGKFVHVYLDDIFIFSNSVPEHEEHLRLVFAILRKAQLYLSRSKVDTYSKRMECLGHIIDDEGIHAEADKLERIRNWRTPRNYKDVIAFLGLVNYLATFMASLAAYTGPLNDICADGASFHWRPIHEKCFETIKAIASRTPILVPLNPGPEEHIFLICDASVSGVGALLGIGKDWQKCRPVGFMSKKFSTAQHVYVTYEQETLAILEALLKWEDKLIGRKFKIMTDHQTLTFLKTQKNMSYRQRRWVEYLDRFDAKIEPVEGVKNKVADALSRYYAFDTPDDMHPDYDYVQADVRLDKNMDDLPRDRVEEIQRMAAMRAEGELREADDARHEEAAELAPEPATETAEPVEHGADDPTAFDSIATESLQPRVNETSEFVRTVRASYDSDKFFSKISEAPADFKGFWIKNGLIYTKNRTGANVLCVPKGNIKLKSLRQIVLETGHEVLGHFGAQKTTDYIRRFYWWPQIHDDVEKYCATCHRCAVTKPENKKPSGLLHSLPIPDRPWGSISMDFVGPFPKSEGFDYLWVIVCRLTGMIHLIPTTTKVRASELAYIFLKEIVRLHGVPDTIISDRDSKFTSKFWQELHRLLGTKLLMSTAFHPQTDGSTERANRTILQVLRTLVQDNQLDWVSKLPLVEFAVNSSVNSSSGFAPFELNYGFMPKTMQDFSASSGTIPGVRQFADAALENQVQAHDALITSRVNQTHYANQSREIEPRYRIGELVYLSTKNITMPKKRARKLTPKYVGPFKIIKANPDTSNYKLELPDTLLDRGIHPNFHASLLRPYRANDDSIFPDRSPAQWYDFGKDNTAEQLVIDIEDHEKLGTKAEDIYFIVRWADGDVTYEPPKNVRRLEALDRYFDAQGVTKWQELPKTSEKRLEDYQTPEAVNRRRGAENTTENVETRAESKLPEIKTLPHEASGPMTRRRAKKL